MKHIKTTYKIKKNDEPQVMWWRPILHECYPDGSNCRSNWQIDDAFAMIDRHREIAFETMNGPVEVHGNRNDYPGSNDTDCIVIRKNRIPELNCYFRGEQVYYRSSWNYCSGVEKKILRREFDAQLLPHVTEELLEELKKEARLRLHKYLIKLQKDKIAQAEKLIAYVKENHNHE